MFLRTNTTAKFNSVHGGHHPVEDRHLRSIRLLQYIPGVHSIFHSGYFAFPFLQPVFQQMAEDRIIFCDQD